ncbi:MAG: universal stress protein [Dehalococcoidia bacterium]
MTILVPVDESEASQAGLSAAVDIARSAGEDIVLVTVGPLPETSAQRDEAFDVLGKHLDQIAGGVTGVKVRTRVQLAGDPVRGILEVADDEKVSQIVMAHTAGSGAALEMGPFGPGLFDASVTEDVEKSASVPVTVVRG